MDIPNDITEGLNRPGGDEAAEFLSNSMESLAEMESFLLSARDNKVLDSADFNPLLKQIGMIRSKIQGVKGSLMGLK